MTKGISVLKGVVRCLEDSDYDSSVCENMECVECRDNTQCESDVATPFCGANTCVECLDARNVREKLAATGCIVWIRQRRVSSRR